MSMGEAILVVDDHPIVVENLRVTLETAGYQALTARDGQGALDLLQTEQVDLILADIAMPGMNGYQLLERVRQHPEWVPIPFVFLTARALDSDVRYGKELGVDDYLTKPIEPEDLLAVVRGKLRRAQQLAPLVAQPAPPPQPAATLLAVGRLRVEPNQHRAWLDDQLLSLSAREFALLQCLAERHGLLVSPQVLIQVTHGRDADAVEAGTLLRPLIRSLRRKLGYAVGERGCIQTVRGVGYRLISP